MGAIIPAGTVAWGLQLPIQSQSTIFVQPWESTAGPEELLSVAQAADRAGALYVGVCDHIAIPRPADEKMSTVWYDTIATLGWLGAQTERVHLLSHVYVLPYRHPLTVAKAFTTLDLLTGGRAILGAGAGHLESEFEVLEVDFDSRGQQVEQALPLIREAFENAYVTAGPSGSERSVGVAPRPARPSGPPIWVGGSSKVAIRRAALLADGWLPQGPPKMGLTRAIEMISSERAEAGLSEAFDIGITGGPVFIGKPGFEVGEYTLVGSVDQVAERLRRYASRGINQIQMQFLGVDASQVCNQIEMFGAEVAPLLQG
ncbi:MAG TPA: TIGR03619 family F420-dependent LLM class oxidoreductase [Microthrixaceae bacterium]|nr:TIGR03619 family F420-dependent LLM class oxidoreductase [Microthrixaceae bacterium]